MTTKSVVTALLLSLIIPVSAQAATIQFTITNTVGATSGTVSGEIDGLAYNGVSSATAVIVTSTPAEFSALMTLPFDFLTAPNEFIVHNSFDLINGVVQSDSVFQGAGLLNLYINVSQGRTISELQDGRVLDRNFDAFGTSNNTFSTAAAAPEPVTWAMMLIGFAGFGGLATRRRATAARA
ncbi:putative secreted protein with PEP-CTERM sorting signal [Roseiarcus fermentans]|uniref:Putative secreted protein with PEP-CTERM sorting signal n=1 Tax=Roseiarcus fermentans TaxID=1473586 RepID=A0A366FHA1_9HYPH|nr:PEP-CTERM sorting domain-containing protein [Roseiarcus fermentans]RBP14053.1 putative secreted protein with PEP-CTERM sorting signal [Roseiarcus fermentans]